MANISASLIRGLILAMLAGGGILWSTPAAADSAATFKAKCAMCHGADGKGETPAGKKMGVRDLSSSDVQKQSDAELAAVTAKGKNKMPSYEKSLKPEEIKDLVDYIRKFAGGK